MCSPAPYLQDLDGPHTAIWWDNPSPRVPYFLTGKKILGQNEPCKVALALAQCTGGESEAAGPLLGPGTPVPRPPRERRLRRSPTWPPQSSREAPRYESRSRIPTIRRQVETRPLTGALQLHRRPALTPLRPRPGAEARAERTTLLGLLISAAHGVGVRLQLSIQTALPVWQPIFLTSYVLHRPATLSPPITGKRSLFREWSPTPVLKM